MNGFSQKLNLLRFLTKNNPKNVMCLFCDLQDKYLPNMYQDKELLKNSVIFSQISKIFQYSNLVTEHVPKVFGYTNKNIIDNLDKDKTEILPKTSFSMLKCENVDKEKVYILLGMETHICVFQTAETIIKMGGNVIVLTDCVSSSSEGERIRGIENLKRLEVELMTLQSLSFFVLENCEDENFKKIVPLMKELNESKMKVLF